MSGHLGSQSTQGRPAGGACALGKCFGGGQGAEVAAQGDVGHGAYRRGATGRVAGRKPATPRKVIKEAE